MISWKMGNIFSKRFAVTASLVLAGIGIAGAVSLAALGGGTASALGHEFDEYDFAMRSGSLVIERRDEGGGGSPTIYRYVGQSAYSFMQQNAGGTPEQIHIARGDFNRETGSQVEGRVVWGGGQESNIIVHGLATAKNYFGANPPPDNAGTTDTDGIDPDFVDLEQQDAEHSCEDELQSRMAWMICPVSDGLRWMVEQLDTWINQLLTVDTARIFGGDGANPDERRSASAFQSAWGSFRMIALGLVIIAALVIIVASAFGLEILDAYTMRKAMPRVLIAVLFITLSWQILEFLVVLSNDVGNGLRALIYAPFADSFDQAQLRSGSLIWAMLGVGGAAFVLGPFALLSFALTAALAILLAFLVLIIRELIIMVLVILAPVAIASMILPNTQKLWQLWQKTLVTVLIMFPLIAAMIATGRVFSVVTYNNGDAGGIMEIIAFAAYIVPYFMLPFAFKMAGGVMAFMGGMASNAGAPMQKALGGFRKRKTAENLDAARRGTRFKGDGRLSNMANRTTRGIANAPKAGVNPWKMRSRFQAATSTGKAGELAEYMDKNADFKGIAGNDDYLQATMKSMGGGDKEEDWRRYLQKQGYQGQALEQGVAQIRAAKRGTSDDVFKQAAVMANASTGTGWKEGGPAAMLSAINEVAGDDRHMANNMLAQMRGAAVQAGRLDLGGPGFGTTAGTMEAMHSKGMNATTANKALAKNVLFTKGAGDFARARGDAVKQLAPQMLNDLQDAHKNVEAAERTGDARMITNAKRELGQHYAALDNLHDSLNHMSPENARIIADSVLGQPIGRDGAGEPVTVMSQIKSYQKGGDDAGSRAFLESKRVYGASEDAEGRRLPEGEES